MALAAEAESPCHAGATGGIRLGEVVDLPLLDVPTLTIHIFQSRTFIGARRRVNHATAIESMIPFVQQVADELTQKPTADEHGCDPCATGARDPSLRRAGCLDRRDERIDPVAMSYDWRMKATSAAFPRSVSCTPRTRLKNSTVSSSVKRRPSCRYGGESLIPRRVKVLMGPSAWIH